MGYDFDNLPADVNTVIINGLDNDLLMTINSRILIDNMDNIKTGINLIKYITNANRVILAVTDKHV